jgi:Asp-tRNA(Asn)/Glu-tRNA(Gln) amidotransferase C subunit
MLSNVSGSQMDYDTFKKQFDSIPQLKNIVAQFDGQGLTIKTKEKPEATRSDKNTSSLATNAKRAAAKSLKQPG